MPSATPQKQTAKIPVVDISPSNPNAGLELLEAAARFGFVFVENNAAAGMPAGDLDDMFRLVGSLSDAFSLLRCFWWLSLHCALCVWVDHLAVLWGGVRCSRVLVVLERELGPNCSVLTG